MTSSIDYYRESTYETRKALHDRAPYDEKDLPFKHVILPKLGVAFMRGLAKSCRSLVMGFEENVQLRELQGQPTISCFWHCNILMVTMNTFGYNARVLISEHSDGELIAQACLRTGTGAVRGSTTRGGGRALVRLKGCLDKGEDLVLTPDGPKGPKGTFQAGALYLAAKTRTPIVPVGAYGDNLIKLRSWDRFRVPKPFSKVAIRWGEAIDIPADAMEDQEQWLRFLESKMEQQEQICKRFLSRTFVGVPRGPWSARLPNIKLRV